MKGALRLTVWLIGLALVPISGADDELSAPLSAGVFRIAEGRTPTIGETYSGRAAIVRVDQNFFLDWQLDHGARFQGCGIRVGRWLGCAFSETPGYGVTVYRRDGGRLSGQWLSVPDEDLRKAVRGWEYLEGPAKLEGEFRIVSAKDPSANGYTYRGTVRITRQGDTHLVRWSLADGQIYTGVGILVDDLLIVGWRAGETGCGVMAYEPTDRGPLQGVWAEPGLNTLGREILVRLPSS